ncbi:MAG: ABC transporter permease [Xanthobacteraceae bacterium]|jgi:NitT/TauT family transport system permease protein
MVEPSSSSVAVPRGIGPTRSWFVRLPTQVPALALPVATAFLFLAAWQMVAVLGHISPAILPPPTMVLARLTENFSLIMKHAYPTTIETLLAFGISIPLGIVLAALLVYSTVAQQALYPNIIFFQLIPKIALAPLFIVWLGIGPLSRITFSVFICFFPILIATAAGLRAVETNMLRLCRSLRMSEWQVLVRIRFPTSPPYIFSGMKISVTLAIIGVVVGEFIASQQGLGYLILFASSRQQTDLALACIAVLCVVGLLLYGLVVVAEKAITALYDFR